MASCNFCKGRSVRITIHELLKWCTQLFKAVKSFLSDAFRTSSISFSVSAISCSNVFPLVAESQQGGEVRLPVPSFTDAVPCRLHQFVYGKRLGKQSGKSGFFQFLLRYIAGRSSCHDGKFTGIADVGHAQQFQNLVAVIILAPYPVGQLGQRKAVVA